MNSRLQADQAELFRSKHRGEPLLLLPNVWDAMSAKVFAAAGFEAIATTSGGVAWALGYQDGERTPWNEVVAATARIVRAAQVPVTADIEAGYGETPEAVAKSVGEIIGAGAVGVNLEDGIAGAVGLRSIADAAARIRAAREAARAAGVPIVINARTDLYLRNIGDEAARFDEAVTRGKAYLAAGADCVYPITLRDPATIERLVKALDGAPININVRAGSPGVAEFEKLRVARISIASQAALLALDGTRRLAEELRRTGRFDALNPSIAQADAQRLFAPG